MRKWQELLFNALMNFSIAIIAGSVLRILLDTQNVISSLIGIVVGAYSLFAFAIIAKNIEEK